MTKFEKWGSNFRRCPETPYSHRTATLILSEEFNVRILRDLSGRKSPLLIKWDHEETRSNIGKGGLGRKPLSFSNYPIKSDASVKGFRSVPPQSAKCEKYLHTVTSSDACGSLTATKLEGQILSSDGVPNLSSPIMTSPLPPLPWKLRYSSLPRGRIFCHIFCRIFLESSPETPHKSFPSRYFFAPQVLDCLKSNDLVGQNSCSFCFCDLQ